MKNLVETSTERSRGQRSKVECQLILGALQELQLIDLEVRIYTEIDVISTQMLTNDYYSIEHTHMHAHTYACTHICMHTRTHARVHTH